MTVMSVIVVFSCLWWITLFIILPIGVKVEAKPEKGMASSAPAHPRIGFKLLITTLISIVLTSVVCWLITTDTLNLSYWFDLKL